MRSEFGGDRIHFGHDEMQQVGVKEVAFSGRSVRERWDGALETVVVEEMDGR